MAEDTEWAERHFREIVTVVSFLASAQIGVYEHHYHHLAFGSWFVVAGKRRHRVRVSWDGKYRELSFERASLRDSQSQPIWQEVSSEMLDSPWSAYSRAVAGIEDLIRH